MVSNAQKKRKLKTILQKLSINQKSDDATLALQKLLMDDCGGKLYKYMPIKEYTIPSLESNTLHISFPATFNDPFDCKIGIDIQSIVDAIFSEEMLELYWEDFIGVNSGEIAFENISDERKPIIANWINNNNLTELINSYKEKQFSYDEAKMLILNNFDIIYEIVFPWAASIAHCDQTSVNIESFRNLIDKITDDEKKKLIEENSNYSDIIRMLGEYEDIDEIGLTEKVYKILNPENPEGIKKFKEVIDSFEQTLNELLCSKFKVSCLCADYKNKLMWSHYADSHKGICVEYDFSKLEGTQVWPMPVCYTKIRPKVPWKEVINQSSQTPDLVMRRLIEALLTKDMAWKYEREWRICIPVNEGVDSIIAPPIQCIYLGALCSDENVAQLKKVANKMGIPIKRMAVDRGEYELHTTSV